MAPPKSEDEKMYDNLTKNTARALLQARDPHRQDVMQMTKWECVAVLEDLDQGGKLCRDLSLGFDIGASQFPMGSSFR